MTPKHRNGMKRVPSAGSQAVLGKEILVDLAVLDSHKIQLGFLIAWYMVLYFTSKHGWFVKKTEVNSICLELDTVRMFPIFRSGLSRHVGWICLN